MLVAFASLPALAQPSGALLAGMYVPGYVEQTRNLRQVETWTGRPLSLAGTFIDLTDHANLGHRLESAWAARTTPFVNVETTADLGAVARGDLDGAIERFARVTRSWLEMGGGRSLIVAPFQEMNLAETPWGCRPEAFREAYRRFVTIFEDAGADARIAWAFAPNGWTHVACGGSSEPYFPGRDRVDLVAISAYNFGPYSWDGRPEGPSEVYEPWLEDVRSYASGLPILIGQTGTIAAGGDRARWLREMVGYLHAQPDVLGFIYFNMRSRSRSGAVLDWRVFDHGDPQDPGAAPGLAAALASSAVGERWPLDWFDDGAVRPRRVDPGSACVGDLGGREPC